MQFWGRKTVRRCLVGLSSATSYNPRAIHRGVPTPILEAPLGVFLLYDEIWFVHRTVCPRNMLSLAYVRFLNDDSRWAEVESLARDLPPVPSKEAGKFLQLTRRTYADKWPSASFSPGLPLSVGGRSLEASPSSLESLVLDTAIATHLEMDLVTNSLGTAAISALAQANSPTTLATLLLGDGFPNLYGKWGPYRPGLRHIIDYLRDGHLLSQYRAKVLEACRSRSQTPVAAIAEELKATMRQLVEETFLKQFKKERPYYALANMVFGEIPVVSSIVSVVLGISDIVGFYRKRRATGWAGFIAYAQQASQRQVVDDG